MSEEEKLKVGQVAPQFAVKDEEGKIVSSSALKGSNFVLYFYPKDDTPGCTIEANEFNGLKKEFEALNCKIFGVSKDSAKSHKAFKEKYCLNFPLLLDEEGELCKAFDVWKEKQMFGKKYMGISRDTFLINKDGILSFIWRNVRANSHADEVLKQLKKL